MSRHERYLLRAEAEAKLSSHPRWHLGAVVVRGSSIISTARNVPRNSPHLLEGGPGTSLHAEINALRKLTYQADRAEGCTIYVVRISRKGERKLARPCSRCYAAIRAAEIKTIVYSLDTPGYAIERVFDA